MLYAGAGRSRAPRRVWTEFFPKNDPLSVPHASRSVQTPVSGYRSPEATNTTRYESRTKCVKREQKLVTNPGASTPTEAQFPFRKG